MFYAGQVSYLASFVVCKMWVTTASAHHRHYFEDEMYLVTGKHLISSCSAHKVPVIFRASETGEGEVRMGPWG